MNTPMTISQVQGRMSTAGLRNAIVAGLVGNVFVNVALQVLIVRTLIVPLTIIMVLTLVIAAVCASRWRWAPLLAVVWILVSVVPGLQPYIFNLTHPVDTGRFVATLLSLALLLVSLVAGVAAMIRRDSGGVGGQPHVAARLFDRDSDVRDRCEPGRRHSTDGGVC